MEEKQEELSRWICDELNDWWSDGHEDFETRAYRMLNFGMEVDTIKEILQDLFSAVQNEYQ